MHQLREYLDCGLITFDGDAFESKAFSDEELMQILMEAFQEPEEDANDVPEEFPNEAPGYIANTFDWDDFLIFLSMQLRLERGKRFLFENKKNFPRRKIQDWWDAWRALKVEAQKAATPAFWGRYYDMFGKTQYKVLCRGGVPINGNRLRFDKWDRIDVDKLEDYVQTSLHTPLTEYFTYSDSEAIDRQTKEPGMDVLRDTHLIEEAQYTTETFDNWEPQQQPEISDEEWNSLLVE